MAAILRSGELLKAEVDDAIKIGLEEYYVVVL